jgi:hypothetical protein
MHVPTALLSVYVVLGSVATAITLLWGLRAAIGRAALTARDQRRKFWAGAALLAGWFFAALFPSLLGLYQGAPTRIPTIEFGLLLPIIGGVALYWRSHFLRRIIAAAPKA